MSTGISEPVRVGKATLANNVLTVDGMACEVRDSSQFASFIQTTSAIIATALETAFGAEVGELVFPKGGFGEFQASGVAPWQQYSRAVLDFGTNPKLSKVIAGWCVLLCVYHRFSQDQSLEPNSIELAWYISTKAYKAAEASPKAVEDWDKYEEWARTLAGAIANLNGAVDHRSSPWAGAVALTLPAPSNMSHVTALDLVGAFGGSILVTDGKARSYVGFEHLLVCTNDVSHVQRPPGHGHNDFIANLPVNGIERRFRVHADERRMELRLQSDHCRELLINECLAS